jgi:hypothetical protein
MNAWSKNRIDGSMDLSGFRVEEMVIGEHFSHRKHTKFSVEY